MNIKLTSDYKNHTGKYVAIVNRNIVVSGEDPKRVWKEARKDYPKAKISILRIPDLR